MRLLAGLVASSLVTFASASSHVAQLSPDETRLLLAERLGVSRFHELHFQGQDIRKTTLEIAAAFEKNQEPVDAMFAETPRKGNFVLSLAGMKDNRLDADLPSMTIVDNTTPASVASLLARLAAEKAELAGSHAAHTFSTTPSGALCVSVPTLSDLSHSEGAALDTTTGLPTRLPADLAALLAPLDTTSLSTSTFLQEFAMIRHFMESVLPALPETGMSYCHAPSLSALISTHGPHSAEALAASSLYSYLLAHLPSSLTSTVLLTSSKPLSKRSESETPLSMHPSPSPALESTSENPAKLLTANIPLCHTSKESCETSTESCLGRGICVKAAKAGREACWTCKCRSSAGAMSGWAGAACQKRDISIPFNLFLGLGLVLVSVSVAAVGMMMNVGAEELPGVLTAGVAPPKRT